MSGQSNLLFFFPVNNQLSQITDLIEKENYYKAEQQLIQYHENNDNEKNKNEVHKFCYNLLMSFRNVDSLDDNNSDSIQSCFETALFFIITYFDDFDKDNTWATNQRFFPNFNKQKMSYADMIMLSGSISDVYFRLCLGQYKPTSQSFIDQIKSQTNNKNTDHSHAIDLNNMDKQAINKQKTIDIRYEVYDRLNHILGDTTIIHNLVVKTFHTQKNLIENQDTDYLIYIIKDWMKQIRHMPEQQFLSEDKDNINKFINYCSNFLIDYDLDFELMDLNVIDEMPSSVGYRRRKVVETHYNEIEFFNKLREEKREVFKVLNNRKSIHPYVKIASIFNDFMGMDEKKICKQYMGLFKKANNNKNQNKLNKWHEVKKQFYNWHFNPPLEIWPVIIKNKNIGLIDYLLLNNIESNYSAKNYGQWLNYQIDQEQKPGKKTIEMIEKLWRKNCIDLYNPMLLYSLLQPDKQKQDLRQDNTRQAYQRLLSFYIQKTGQNQYEALINQIKNSVKSAQFNQFWNNLSLIYNNDRSNFNWDQGMQEERMFNEQTFRQLEKNLLSNGSNDQTDSTINSSNQKINDKKSKKEKIL